VPAAARGHGSHGAGSAGAGHFGAGIVTIRPDEDARFAIDLYGYFAASLARGWRMGEPLGAGGKLPLYYNQYLYREGPFERAALAKKDYWPQYRDFSYVPLWQPSQLGIRAQYRFLPTVQGTVTVAHFGSVDRVTEEPTALEFEELHVRWSPARAPGLSLTVGRLFLVGAYSVPFDQFPLENFLFDGAAARYERPMGGGELAFQIAAGTAPLGRTTRVEEVDTDPGRNLPILDSLRARNHLYATAGHLFGNGASIGALVGYQVIPADSSTSNDPVPVLHVWPRRSGWQAGFEVGLARERLQQHLTVSHGRGDVEMGWGAPDYVDQPSAGSSQDRFLRQGSALTQISYWGGAWAGRMALLGGAWAQWRRPAKETLEWRRPDGPTGEQRLFQVTPQDFRALRINLIPMVTAGPITAGIRLDGIRYFDKNATTNTVEPQTDEALRPIIQVGPDGVGHKVFGPSFWEREAADCAIVSPFAEAAAGSVFKVRLAWSGAWYSAPVYRQHRVSSFHANVSLSAWLVHRFAGH